MSLPSSQAATILNKAAFPFPPSPASPVQIREQPTAKPESRTHSLSGNKTIPLFQKCSGYVNKYLLYSHTLTRNRWSLKRKSTLIYRGEMCFVSVCISYTYLPVLELSVRVPAPGLSSSGRCASFQSSRENWKELRLQTPKTEV